MKVLCITDLVNASTDHSSISGVFGTYLRGHCEVVVVRFSREAKEAFRDGGDVVIPYARKGRVFQELARLGEMSGVDLVVVRNFIGVLWQALRCRPLYGFRVGFWSSFPHAYRRYFQAQLEKKSLWRKSLEYKVRSLVDKTLIRRCDFLMAMSPEFKETYYPECTVPFFPLPMGVDFSTVPQEQQPKEERFRAIYTGTIDSLRQVDLILEAMCGVTDDFVLDFFSSSRNAAVDQIKSYPDPRVRLHGPLPRAELFRRITGYDLGIGVIPEHKLYEVSSPTKTLEYYALGVPALVSYLPEYTKLFDEGSAFFCHFNLAEMRDAFQRAVRTPRAELSAMGERGREVIREKRNYQRLAEDLHGFLSAQAAPKHR